MPGEYRAALALLTALGAAHLLVPVAIRLAERFDVLDHPGGYKTHGAATPYLGGLATLGGVLLGAAAGGVLQTSYAALVLGALLLCAVGTVDDRRMVSPQTRVLVEVAVASALFATGLGWEVASSDWVNYALSCLWVVGVVNAFNLMDNMDGAAATVAIASSAGTAIAAAALGAPDLAVLALALSGACLGFLRHNLARPARLFLGDGGSMPIGLLAAASVMALSGVSDTGWPLLLALAPLAGLPLFDTAMVIVTRIRHGVPIMTGGHDHLTWQLLERVGNARRVAVALALLQSVLSLTAVYLIHLDRSSMMAAAPIALAVVTAALVAIAAWCYEPPNAGLG